MMLHEIPRESKIYAALSDGSKYLIYDHPDGMFSYCVSEKGGVVHLSLFSKLRKYKDGYRLA